MFCYWVETLEEEKSGGIWVHEEKSGVLLLGFTNFMKRKLGVLLIGVQNQNYGLLIWR